MGYSSLATVQVWSPNMRAPRERTIDSVAIHCMAGNLTAQGCGEVFLPTSRRASSNYGVASDGTIGVYVDENNRSWCTSSSGVDSRAITIEVANTVASDPWPVSDQAYEALINLLVDICRRNPGLRSGLRWKADKQYALQAAAGGPVTEQNMFAHRWFEQKACPGDYLYSRFGQIADEVNRRLKLNIPLQGAVGSRKIVFIGDSRTVGMKAAVGSDNNIWSCKGSMSYDWMVKTGVPAVENQIGGTTAVCILMGINDMIYRPASDYSSYINKKGAEWIARGSTVFFVSINPVRKTGYKNITNEKIQTYNSQIRSALNAGIGYIDTYSAIFDSFNAPDGLHYDNATYKQIYDVIVAQAGSGGASTSFGISLNIDYKNFNPYIITLDRTTPQSFKLDKLRENRIVASVVEAGYYYSTRGAIMGKFENPLLSKQMAALDDADIPFGLFTIVRATSVRDARQEMYEFSFVIRRYPPKLGVWLQLDLRRAKSVNDGILQYYVDELTRLGFKSKMGIICDRKMLEKLDWDKFQNDFYLWLIDHVSSVDELDQLMNPEFFAFKKTKEA